MKAEIYLFTMGTPYKINSRTLVLASSGEGTWQSNVPPPRHSAHHRTTTRRRRHQPRTRTRTTRPRGLRNRSLNNLSRSIKHNINQRIKWTIAICLLSQAPWQRLANARIGHVGEIVAYDCVDCLAGGANNGLYYVAEIVDYEI